MNIVRANTMLNRSDAVLMVIDCQDAILHGSSQEIRTLAQIQLLVKTAHLLEIPIIATVQYPERLGGITSSLAATLPHLEATAIPKLTFSAWREPNVRSVLAGTGRKQIVVCGLETHICVCQTAIDLAVHGFSVHVVADAVTSHTVELHKLGMERMRDSGILPCAAESVVYEWLERAGTLEFKEVLGLIKVARNASTIS